jgi:hypothetical protein
MAGFHGGDWEGIQVILDKDGTPTEIWFLGHTTIDKRQWETIADAREGAHVKVLAEYGGHSSSPFTGKDESQLIRQECWTGGTVTGSRAGFGLTKTGPLLNVGEKTKPFNGQVFIQYSGLWGSPSRASAIGQSLLPLPGNIQSAINKLSAALYPFNSGYWGPSYNETEKRETDDFITAWGHNMKDMDKEVDGIKENYPTWRLPQQ